MLAEGERQAHANIHKENIKNELPTLTHMKNMCQSRREIYRKYTKSVYPESFSMYAYIIRFLFQKSYRIKRRQILQEL